eukprot:3487504-Prymnesium_polylepis.1
MAWDLVPADAASALPRLRRAAASRPSPRPTRTYGTTCTRWSCSRPTATSRASTHCMGLRCHVDTHSRRGARARAALGASAACWARARSATRTR